jgi:NAD-dependent deacetylase
MSDALIDQLATDLTASVAPLFITGAGISVASGIQPFRGTDGAVWSQTVLEMGTQRMFRQDPARQWKWYLDRFDSCRGARPNAAHDAITQLQAWKAMEGVPLRVVTQNIDGLHVDAGTKDVIEVHGKARHVRCSRPRCENGSPKGLLPWDESQFAAFRADPVVENLPRCPACGLLLRPHVLWFDETYVEHFDYRFDEATELFWKADLVVFVGTSFAVTITENALIAAGMKGAHVWSIDPHSAPPPGAGTWLQSPSEVALPQLLGTLTR